MRTAALLTALFALAATAPADIPDDVQALIDSGAWTEARAQLQTLGEEADEPRDRSELLFEAERLRRIALDFRWTADDMAERLRENIADVTVGDVERWADEGWLQTFVIDGERRYFPRDERHLRRHCPEARERMNAERVEPDPDAPRSDLSKIAGPLQAHVQEVIAAAREDDDGLVLPQRQRVQHVLRVHPGEVPEGETLRCWLTVPRDEPHQTDLEILWTDPPEHVLAPPDAPQRSVYMERPAAASPEMTEFRVCYEFTSSAFYREIDPLTIQPHDTESDLYRTYTAEEPPHVVFTPEIVEQTQEVVRDETNPHLRARLIYDWINDNITYASEREYSTLRNISDICYQRKRGDCGIQSILFITMCRAAGVPARWESGWQLEPGSEGMHDWARFHVEPYGWLWADPSYNHHPRWEGEAAQTFYFGNVDAWRLVANSAYSQEFHPPKEHFRSETVDFQRGEVEWAGGNLYFDQWDWDLIVEAAD